jgi:hypothetical protein
MAGKYVMLIGEDTKSKHNYVRWGAEVALEQECTIIGVNLNGRRNLDYDRCPPSHPRCGGDLRLIQGKGNRPRPGELCEASQRRLLLP